MAYELKDNSGSLFKNGKKEKETHPDYRGEVMVNGKKMSLSAWIKDGKSGKFMSLSFQEPYVKPEGQAEKPNRDAFKEAAGKSFDNFDDDIPF